MNSLGQILRTERERRGLSLEHVARETNISRVYLEALENENYSVFPGEPYLFGFLRNYAEFLELSSQDLINAYRSHKIQEQPSPLEDLVPPRASLPWKTLAAVGVGALVLGAGIFWWADLVRFVQDIPRYLFTDSGRSRSPQTYVLDAENRELDRRLYTGDRIEVVTGAETVSFEVSQIGDSVTLVSPLTEIRLRLGQETFLDLDEDRSMDLRIGVTDLDPRNPAMGAGLSLQRIETGQTIAGVEQTPVGNEAPVVIENNPNIRPDRQRPSVVVASVAAPGPIQVEISFRGKTLLRYQADERPREEGVWEKGEVLRVDATRQIFLGASNASAFSLRVNGKDIDLNAQDQVIARVLRWTQSGPGYQLRLDPVY